VRPIAVQLPSDARAAAVAPVPARLTDVHVKVYYQSRCLGLASSVGKRLLALGANPGLLEARQTVSDVSRVTYMGVDHLPIAAAIARRPCADHPG
jgi:hypothetical protein